MSRIKFKSYGRKTTGSHIKAKVSVLSTITKATTWHPLKGLKYFFFNLNFQPSFFNLNRDNEIEKGYVRVYPGKLQVSEPHVIVLVDDSTTVKNLMREALNKFGLKEHKLDDYR